MSDPHLTSRTVSSLASPDAIMAHTYSLTAILGAFMGYLPDVAAFFAAVWYAIVIWESKTVQGALARRHHKSDTEKPTPEEVHG